MICKPVLFVAMLLAFPSHSEQIEYEIQQEINLLIANLNNVLNFVEKYFYLINFDGLLGIVLAEAQLLEAQQQTSVVNLEDVYQKFFVKIQNIRELILPNLSNLPTRYNLFSKYLQEKNRWIVSKGFTYGELEDLGIYSEWTKDTILEDKHAWFHGVPTDTCLEELLRNYHDVATTCYVSRFCEAMMLSSRNDTGYLLTHRLLYLQVARLRKCNMDNLTFRKYTKKFCSLILKEAKTNEHLGFPQQDIFLEQIVLCGAEGFVEFLKYEWREKSIAWQNYQGCYTNKKNGISLSRRNSNKIVFDCTDHTTGLGAAALALNLRYVSALI